PLLHARDPRKVNRSQEDDTQDWQDQGKLDHALAAPVSPAAPSPDTHGLLRDELAQYLLLGSLSVCWWGGRVPHPSPVRGSGHAASLPAPVVGRHAARGHAIVGPRQGPLAWASVPCC